MVSTEYLGMVSTEYLGMVSTEYLWMVSTEYLGFENGAAVGASPESYSGMVQPLNGRVFLAGVFSRGTGI